MRVYKMTDVLQAYKYTTVTNKKFLQYSAAVWAAYRDDST